MAESTAFSASGEEVISRKIEVEAEVLPQDLSQHDFEEYFEIERTAQEVVKHDYKRVRPFHSILIYHLNSVYVGIIADTQIALQFPDELLHVSVPIFRALKAKAGPGHDFYVLADTSYGRHAAALVTTCMTL